MTTKTTQYVLILRCPDRKGIVAAVAGYLAENDTSITESHQFDDAIKNEFFMRVAFRPDGEAIVGLERLKQGFAAIAERFAMQWEMHDMSVPPRVIIAVSKFGHCLYDLLHRWRSSLLPLDIRAVVSNHEDMQSFVEWSGVPFFHLPPSLGREAQEARFLDIVANERAELVVLARYMQILSSGMCETLAGRCINIHHSFLPSFKGARPYHQAYERGVKLIGATAHYVTPVLDEGPIIEQDIQRVNHGHAPAELVALGRDVECRVLARAVRWHIERRIIIVGSKTVVFS